MIFIVNGDAVVKKFLTGWLPDQINILQFGSFWADLVNVSSYLKEITKTCWKVKILIYFGSCHFSKKSFEDVMRSWYHCERIQFENWKIETHDKLDISGPKYATEYIDFHASGKCDRSDWSCHPTRFQNIIKAFANSSLKHCLDTVGTGGCGLDSTVEQMFSDSGLGNTRWQNH